MNREHFFKELEKHLTHDELEKAQWAYFISKEAHRQQKRDGGERYFEHPRRVAYELMRRGVYDVNSICAALLHDTVEDTHVPTQMIERLFGKTVLRYVLLLSKITPTRDNITGFHTSYVKKPLDEYHTEIANGPREVRLIKLCDRLDNLRSIMNSGWKIERKRRYIAETIKYFLPMAKETDEALYRALSRIVNKHKSLL